MLLPISVQALAKELASHNYSYTNEIELQNGIEEVLRWHGCVYLREARLTRNDRIDFIVDGIGIEVKISGSTSDLLTQVWRYVHSDLIKAVIVVTVRARHIQLPDTMNDKPVKVVHLLRSCL